MIVMKFGGTSVGDADRIAHVAALATSGAEPPVVVVSAMARVTNTLIETARLAAEGRDTYRDRLAALEERHHAVADALLHGGERDAARRFTSDRLAEVAVLCNSIAVLGETSARATDRIAGVGEKLSANLLAAAIRARGYDANYVDATHVLVTDSSFGGANPLMDETRARAAEVIRPILAAGAIPVVTGYIGSDRSGTPTTIGRGGGDYSAAIFGAALDADEVWIWTDVDGILTADPKIVPEARTLEELTYVEAAQLAYFGAEVLHPKTVKPLVDRGIPLRIKNTFCPERAGTTIVERSHRGNAGPLAIITSKGLSAVAVVGDSEGWSPAISARALTAMSRAGVDVLMFGQSFVEKTVSLLVRGQDADHALRVLQREFAEECRQGMLRDITVQQPVASVSVVGAAADDSFSVASRTFAALSKQKAHILTIAQAYSEYNVTFVVPQAEVDDTVRLIHAELCLG